MPDRRTTRKTQQPTNPPTNPPTNQPTNPQLVTSGHFSTRVPLFRCIRNFICQFGLSGAVGRSSQRQWGSIKDDPSWLPLGPAHRENEQGVKRFAKGYLAYAGGGKNSRGVQLIMALGPNGRLCGGSPWEVPWGEVVGDWSFRTIDAIYVGYGEKGPSQGGIQKGGANYTAEKFPLLDYITRCTVVDDTEQREEEEAEAAVAA